MNSLLPLWLSGTLLKVAVSGVGLAVTASVATLVRDSLLPVSSVKVTRTWMVCPCWLVARARLAPVAPSMSAPPAIYW